MGRGGDSSYSATRVAHKKDTATSADGSDGLWQELFKGFVLRSTPSKSRWRSLLTNWLETSQDGLHEKLRSSSTRGFAYESSGGGLSGLSVCEQSSDISLSSTRHGSEIYTGREQFSETAKPYARASHISAAAATGGGLAGAQSGAFTSTPATVEQSVPSARADTPTTSQAEAGVSPTGSPGHTWRGGVRSPTCTPSRGSALVRSPSATWGRADNDSSGAFLSSSTATTRGPEGDLSSLNTCYECGERNVGPIFMLNDRPYCCQRHRLSAYHKREQLRFEARYERITCSAGLQQCGPAHVASSGLDPRFPVWIG